MNPRIVLAFASSMRLQRLVEELDRAEQAARADFGIATLTSMEIPERPAGAIEREGEMSERALLQALDREIASALERAREAENRWTPEELEKFRTVTDRVNEHLGRIGRVVRRIRECVAVAVLSLTALSGPPGMDEPKPAEAPTTETRPAPPMHAPKLNIDVAFGWLRDLPGPHETKVSKWPDGEIALTRMPQGSPALDALEAMRLESRNAAQELLASLPPDVVTMMEEEAKMSPDVPEISMRAFVGRLSQLQEQGDPRAEIFMQAIEKTNERIEEIQSSHESALEPLMAVFVPAKNLVDVGLKPELGLDSPEGKQAIDAFARAMADIGVRVEYKSGW